MTDLLPIEIWQEILDRTDFIDKFSILSTCQIFNEQLKITDFYNIPRRYLKKLNDQILQKHDCIQKLYVDEYSDITN